MADDCDQKFVEVEYIKSSLWSRFAGSELAPLARQAENAMDRADEIDVERITLELSAVQSNYLRESIEKTSDKLAQWKSWIPAAHAEEFQERVVNLTDRRELL